MQGLWGGWCSHVGRCISPYPYPFAEYSDTQGWACLCIFYLRCKCKLLWQCTLLRLQGCLRIRYRFLDASWDQRWWRYLPRTLTDTAAGHDISKWLFKYQYNIGELGTAHAYRPPSYCASGLPHFTSIWLYCCVFIVKTYQNAINKLLFFAVEELQGAQYQSEI
jgi:hypothetical protein